MNLDPANTVNYPAQCAAGIGPSASAPVSTSRTSSRTVSAGVSTSATGVRSASSASGAGQPASQTPVPTPTTPVTPAAIGGGLQTFGGCPNGDCSGGDSSKTNIYDVSKDSNAVSGARGAAGGRGALYSTGAGLVVLAGLVWL